MKQLIKGSDVILWDNGIPETISNVLIGEPNSQDMTNFSDESGLITYILAIPKGDSHVWTDRKISFFGENFRTMAIRFRESRRTFRLHGIKKSRCSDLLQMLILLFLNVILLRSIYLKTRITAISEAVNSPKTA